MPSAQASEIQSKLVAAIRNIAELEEKIEQCEKKSKELSADVERRSRQTFYLERNLDTREREIAELTRTIYTLGTKGSGGLRDGAGRPGCQPRSHRPEEAAPGAGAGQG